MIEIIGTSHIARQSINEIRRKISEEKPDIVAVELDTNRLHALLQKEQRVQLRDIWRLGAFGFIFAKLGAWLQKELGKKVGIMPGADMKVAVNEARKIKAKLFLIDRPLQVTLQRLSQKMSRFEKAKLFWFILFGSLYPENRKLLKQINLAKVPGEKLIEKMITDLREKFPALYKVLIEERNNYMAHNLIKIREHFPGAKIVAVVGAGHLRALQELISSKA